MFANQDMTDEYFNQSLFYDFMMLIPPPPPPRRLGSSSVSVSDHSSGVASNNLTLGTLC